MPGVPGGGGACPASLDEIGKASWGLDATLEGRVKASLSAAASLKEISAKLEADVTAACGMLAKDLGAKDADLAPKAAGPGKSAEAACQAAAKLIGDLKAKAKGKVEVKAKEPRCVASMDAMADCAGHCDASVKPGSAKVTCEGGKLSGACDAECKGTCTVEAGAACEGSCSGECKGSCEAGFSGKCDANCDGKCDGKNAAVRAWNPQLVEGRERGVTVMPLFHVYGLTVIMGVSVASGSAMVLIPRFELEHVLRAIDKHRPRSFAGAPRIYVAAASAPDLARYDLRSVEVFQSGSAPLPVEVQTRFEQLAGGGRVLEGYGLTEAAPVTHTTPRLGERKFGSIGVPIPDVDAKIVDLETGTRDLPVGETGELVLRGPNLMDGYYQRPEETALVLRDGWLYTGDVARMDEDGYFYIVDRRKS